MKPAATRAVTAPIIIFGAGRSGTTLVTDVLGAHRDVLGVNEPRLIWRFGNDRWSDQLRPAHARPEVTAQIHASFGRLLAEAGASRLAENTPGNALRPQFVDTVFPDARYIHITRNGWTAIPSKREHWERRSTGFDKRQVQKLGRRIREARPSQFRFYAAEVVRRLPGLSARHIPLYGPRPAGYQEMADELGRLEAAATSWRTCVESVSIFGRDLGPDRYLEFKLEGLDDQAVTTMMDFCGLAPDDAPAELFRQQYSPDLARRQPRLSPTEEELIAPYVRPANAWLGYPEHPGTSPR